MAAKTGTYTLIASTTVAGTSTNTVTFSSIPATYTDLVLVSSIRSEYADIFDGAVIRFNSDTGSNYSVTQLRGSGSVADSSRWTNETYVRFQSYAAAGSTSASGTYSANVFNIMDYANTTTNKTVLARTNVAGAGLMAVVGLWRSTAAINSITFIGYSGNISVGSNFKLYGIEAGNL